MYVNNENNNGKNICRVLPFEKTAPGTFRRIRFSVSGSTGSRATNCDGAKLHSARDFFTTPPPGSVIIKHCCWCCRRLNNSKRSTGELCGQIVRDPDARSPCVRNKRFPTLLIAPLGRPFHFNLRALIKIFMLFWKCSLFCPLSLFVHCFFKGSQSPTCSCSQLLLRSRLVLFASFWKFSLCILINI